MLCRTLSTSRGYGPNGSSHQLPLAEGGVAARLPPGGLPELSGAEGGTLGCVSWATAAGASAASNTGADREGVPFSNTGDSDAREEAWRDIAAVLDA